MSARARIERQDAPIRVVGEHGTVAVTDCRPGILRVALAEAGPSAPSFVEPRSWPVSPFEIVEAESSRLVTPALRLDIAPAPLRLSFADAAGAWLLREPADAGMEGGPGTDRVRAAFEFAGEQHFYGLGQGGGRLDRLGSARQLWNSHLGHGPGSDIGIPLLISSRGYALFFDNPADGTLAVGRSDNGVRIAYTAERGPLVWYFLVAPDLPALLGEVGELLGRARCRRTGRSASCNPRVTSGMQPSWPSCRARSATGAFRATR